MYHYFCYFFSNYDKFKFLYVGGSHASTLECLYDCLLDIMFLFCRNKLILILILSQYALNYIAISRHTIMITYKCQRSNYEVKCLSISVHNGLNVYNTTKRVPYYT